MSASVNPPVNFADLKAKLDSRVAASEVLDLLKDRAMRLVGAIEFNDPVTNKPRSQDEREDLATVLGGVGVMIHAIEAGLALTGSALELQELGLLAQARNTVREIDAAVFA